MNAVRRRFHAENYPRQFWLLFWGLLISRSGTSMVWPFLTIYMRNRLQLPLATISLLFTVQTLAGLTASTVAGPVMDRFGRKGAMVFSLASSSCALVAMTLADSFTAWLPVIAIQGAVNPLFGIGSNAMVADLVEPERRPGAYALLRMIANLGVVIGPIFGGFAIAVSYELAFYTAALAQAAFSGLVLLLVADTLPTDAAGEDLAEHGYLHVLRDRVFMSFVGVSILFEMAAAMMFLLGPLYMKEQFHLPEHEFSFILATNASMVVLFQYTVTQITRRYSPLPVMAAGAVFYGIGVGLMAWAWNFPTFWGCMVIMTIGELAIAPTSTTLAANLAPPDRRATYMSLHNLTFGLGFGLGPVAGGLLNDRIAPAAIWHGGMILGLAAALGFVLLQRAPQVRRSQAQPVEQESLAH